MTPAVSMRHVVEALAETYTDDGVAMVLAAANRHFEGATTIAMCQTADGRRYVLEWAESLTGMIAT